MVSRGILASRSLRSAAAAAAAVSVTGDKRAKWRRRRRRRLYENGSAVIVRDTESSTAAYNRDARVRCVLMVFGPGLAAVLPSRRKYTLL